MKELEFLKDCIEKYKKRSHHNIQSIEDMNKIFENINKRMKKLESESNVERTYNK